VSETEKKSEAKIDQV